MCKANKHNNAGPHAAAVAPGLLLQRRSIGGHGSPPPPLAAGAAPPPAAPTCWLQAALAVRLTTALGHLRAPELRVHPRMQLQQQSRAPPAARKPTVLRPPLRLTAATASQHARWPWRGAAAPGRACYSQAAGCSCGRCMRPSDSSQPAWHGAGATPPSRPCVLCAWRVQLHRVVGTRTGSLPCCRHAAGSRACDDVLASWRWCALVELGLGFLVFSVSSHPPWTPPTALQAPPLPSRPVAREEPWANKHTQ